MARIPEIAAMLVVAFLTSHQNVMAQSVTPAAVVGSSVRAAGEASGFGLNALTVSKTNLRKSEVSALTELPSGPSPSGSLPGNAVSAEPLGSRGKEFWVCFQQNADMSSSLSLSLTITSEVTTTVDVEIPGEAWQQTYPVVENQSTTVVLPNPATLAVTTSEVIDAKGVHLYSEDVITVYGMNQMVGSTDAFLALPVDVLGVAYIVMAYGSVNADISKSQVAVVSPYDDNEVSIIPSAPTEHTAAGVAINVTLDEGEVYQIQSVYPYDLTGTVIESSLPVAVFAGNSCAYVPTSTGLCDHLVEQLPPASILGTHFITYPLTSRENGDAFRLLGTQHNTTVTCQPSVGIVPTLHAGDLYEFTVSEPIEIHASKPLVVEQFSTGDQWDPGVALNGDPFAMLCLPTGQYMDRYTFHAPAAGFDQHYVNIIVPLAGRSTMNLDGLPVNPATLNAIGTSGYYGASLSVDTGSHTIDNAAGIPFGLYCYGFVAYTSYGYPGGISLLNGKTTRTYDVAASWNMVSVPLQMDDMQKEVLYPDVISDASGYSGGYVTIDTLQNGIGYWLKFPAAQSVALTGYGISADTIPVTTGWNMIGSITAAVPISQITSNPPGLTVSPFFTYTGGYVTSDSIKPHRAYWVKVQEGGELILTAGGGSGGAVQIVTTGERPPTPLFLTGDAPAVTPRTFELKECYPNPFNPSTTIQYVLPSRSHVTLAVYNTLGQIVRPLVNAEMGAGFYEVQFEANNLASGVYLYRMTAGDFCQTKKLVVLR